MSTEKTPTQLFLAVEAVKSEENPRLRGRPARPATMAVSEADQEKILKLVQNREQIPSGKQFKRQRDRISYKIHLLRHPEFSPDPVKRAAAQKRWIQRHPEQRKRVALDYYYRTRPPLKTRVLVMTRSAIYCRNLRKRSVQYALQCRLRVTMARALKRQFVKKSARTFELIGCSPSELKAHIESLFKPGMTWANRNLWHVDHKRPLNSFDLRDPGHQKLAFHWTNLQPLWAWENLTKSDK